MTRAEAELLLATLRGGWGRTSLAETRPHIPMGDIAALLRPLRERGHWQERRLPGRPGVIERTWVPSSTPPRARRSLSRPRRSPALGSRDSAVELRESEPARFSVSLPSGVVSAIETELRDALWRFDGVVETGGYLYGLSAPHTNFVDVCFASGPGRDARHAYAAVDLSSVSTIESEFADVLRRAELVRVGSWHSYPVEDGRPSPPDLNAGAFH